MRVYRITDNEKKKKTRVRLRINACSLPSAVRINKSLYGAVFLEKLTNDSILWNP